MNELQLLRHAKGYLDQLARGVDPISGSAVPEDSTLNQERLSKCFQYVSQVLQREIDQLQTPEAAPKEKPDGVQAGASMAALCTSLGFTGNPRFLNKALYEWLIREGYATAQPRTDSKLPDYRPTRRGEAAGLSAVEHTDGEGHTSFVLVCGGQGQQLLRDSMEQIMALEREQWAPLLSCLTPEWRSRATCLERPSALTALVKQLNSQLPKDLPRKLSPSELSNWLVWKGFLELAVIRKKPMRLPTQAGEKLGVQSEHIWERNRSVLWSPSAQQFILDSLNEIVQDLASGEAYKWGPREPVLTEESRRQLHTAANAVGFAYTEKAINTAFGCGEGRPSLMPKGLMISWLHQEGYVERPAAGEANRPTGKGEAVGIAAGDGGYLQLSPAGQQFIYDSLEQIFDYYKTLR